MARSTKTAAPASPTRTRRAAIKTKAAASPAAQPKAAAKPTPAPAKLSASPKAPSAATAPRVPPPSKGELREQVAKLEAANAMLKAKSRDANRAAKAASRRVGELETELADLREAAAAKPARPGRGGPRRRAIDPGDAAPPGVAVEAPEPMDAEAEATKDALEEHLHRG